MRLSERDDIDTDENPGANWVPHGEEEEKDKLFKVEKQRGNVCPLDRNLLIGDLFLELTPVPIRDTSGAVSNMASVTTQFESGSGTP